MNQEYYVSLRIVKATSKEEANEQVENGNFCEDHPVCDEIILLDKVLLELITEKLK